MIWGERKGREDGMRKEMRNTNKLFKREIKQKDRLQIARVSADFSIRFGPMCEIVAYASRQAQNE